MSRKTMEAMLYDVLDTTTGDTVSSDIYRELLKPMSDSQVRKWIVKMVKGDDRISIILPPYGKGKLDRQVLLKVAKKYGIKMFHKVRKGVSGSSESFLGETEYLVIDLVIKRVSQTQMKKTKVAKNNNHIDILSGQVSGDSKAASMSDIELEILGGMNAHNVLLEIANTRGGDMGAARAFAAMANNSGEVSLRDVMQHSTRREANKLLKKYWKGMHINSNV